MKFHPPKKLSKSVGENNTKHRTSLSRAGKGVTIETAGRPNANTAQSKTAINNGVKVNTKAKKGQKSPARKPKPKTAINPILDTISAIRPGLTIVSIQATTLVPQVRNTLEHEAAKKSRKIGLPMPDVEVMLSLYSGNHRRLEQAKALSFANRKFTNSVQHEFMVCGTRDGFDWFGDEGLTVLLPIIKAANGWVTFEQHLAGPIQPSLVDGLSRVRHAAQQAGVWAMVFLTCIDSFEKSGLHELCDEYIEVSPCDPDPGSETAFSIDCVGLKNLNHLGIGKTMCNIKLVDGVYHRFYSAFISSSLETRMMCLMRGKGLTLEKIGDIVKKDKSTVQRRLEGLKIPKCGEFKDALLKLYCEQLGLNYSLDNTDWETNLGDASVDAE